MLIIQIVFFLLIVLGVGVILMTKNVIHAAYALALVLVGLAGIYVFLFAELLAVVQLLLYAGGVVVLLVFGVMMTNRLKSGKLETRHGGWFFPMILSIAVFAFLSYLFAGLEQDNSVKTKPVDQIEWIGISFLTDHIVAFELIAFVLLVALVGASYLAKMSSNE